MAKMTVSNEKIDGAWQFLQPSVPVLVTTRNEDNSTNVAPFGWIQPVSADPPLISISIMNDPKHKGKTLQNIEREQQFVVNIPSMDIAARLVKSSHWVFVEKNKMEIAGFSEIPGETLNVPRVAEAIAHLECVVEQLVTPGDHTLVIARIVSASYDENAYSHDLLLRLDQVKPCIHMKQYNREIDQVHVFLDVSGCSIQEVPFAGGGNINLFQVDPERAKQLPNKSGGTK